jgi:hypothetical protein
VRPAPADVTIAHLQPTRPAPADRPTSNRDASSRVDGGRRWWAHLACTRINIEPTFLRKKVEELMNVKGIGEKSFLKLKPLISVGAEKTDRAGAEK